MSREDRVEVFLFLSARGIAAKATALLTRERLGAGTKERDEEILTHQPTREAPRKRRPADNLLVIARTSLRTQIEAVHAIIEPTNRQRTPALVSNSAKRNSCDLQA